MAEWTTLPVRQKQKFWDLFKKCARLEDRTPTDLLRQCMKKQIKATMGVKAGGHAIARSEK
jgi:hypothetical protein